MSNELKYYSRVVNGKIAEGVALSIRDTIVKAEGKNLVITIKEQGKWRSDKQNAYYWGVVIPAIKDLFEVVGTSLTPEDVHCFLKEHVAGMMKVILLPDGGRRVIVESSAKLTTVEWENYMEKVRAWAAQWDLVIPEPNEHIEPPEWLDEVLEGKQLTEYRA
jgi:hypothetical protein